MSSKDEEVEEDDIPASGITRTIRFDEQTLRQLKDLEDWWGTKKRSATVRKAIEWAWMFEQIRHSDIK